MAWVLLLPTLGVAAWWLVRRSPPGPARWALAGALLVTPALGWLLPRAADPPEGTPRLEPRGGYVGSASCVACHPREHRTWHESFHRSMTQVARDGAILAPRGRHALELEGQLHEIEHLGGRMYVTMADPHELAVSPGGGAAPLARREVVLTTGSHHYQAYWVRGQRQGELRAAPFVWHREAERFIPRHDVFLQPPNQPDHLVRWNSNCLACHATAARPAHDQAGDTFSTEAVELGIACESCHGPGAAHVERYRDPFARYAERGRDERAKDIVNPAKIDKARSAEVCGQCHAYSFPKDPDAWWRDGYAKSFVAGAELSEDRHLIGLGPSPKAVALSAATESLFWPDGTIRVGGRELNGLAKSACFERGHGERKIACVDCHQLHGADPNDQLSAEGASGEACVGCHAGYDSAAHTHHVDGSVGSSCYGCHMPRVSYALYRAQRSHRIDSPRPNLGAAGDRPPACNLCHVDRTLSWTREHLARWYDLHTDGAAPEGELALALTLALGGDAASRVIAADHLAAPEALLASGSSFQLPVLAELLEDPYAAVRFVAARGLVALGALSAGEYDFLGSAQHRAKVKELVRSRFRPDASMRRPELLIPDGKLDQARLSSEKAVRDDRPVLIAE